MDGKYTVVKIDKEKINRFVDKNLIFYIEPERFKYLLVGLIKDGFCLGVGIVKEIDFKNKTLNIITPIEDKVDELRFGIIKLTPEGVELQYLDRELL